MGTGWAAQVLASQGVIKGKSQIPGNIYLRLLRHTCRCELSGISWKLLSFSSKEF
jgi:hypothetical protein